MGHHWYWGRFINWGRMMSWSRLINRGNHWDNRFNLMRLRVDWMHWMYRMWWRSSMFQKLLAIMTYMHEIKLERAVSIMGWRRSMNRFENHFFDWSTRVNNSGCRGMMVNG